MHLSRIALAFDLFGSMLTRWIEQEGVVHFSGTPGIVQIESGRQRATIETTVSLKIGFHHLAGFNGITNISPALYDNVLNFDKLLFYKWIYR
jgi:hypothetical protein